MVKENYNFSCTAARYFVSLIHTYVLIHGTDMNFSWIKKFFCFGKKTKTQKMAAKADQTKQDPVNEPELEDISDRVVREEFKDISNRVVREEFKDFPDRIIREFENIEEMLTEVLVSDRNPLDFDRAILNGESFIKYLRTDEHVQGYVENIYSK